ncbi:MAG: hypothetical protein AB7S77_09040 [Desulfatirhabdiaceae bacterium]
MLSNRDYSLANELTLKTCFLTLLYNDLLYIMDSEPELERRYSDLTMIIRPDKRYLKIFDVLIEFKFLSLKTLGQTGEQLRAISRQRLYELPAVQKAFDEGHAQTLDYGACLACKYPELRLKSFVVVALGFERVCFLACQNSVSGELHIIKITF